jgi:arginine/serine-rich splicing factor 4/5/6
MSTRVFVGRLSERTTESSLRGAFEPFGDVKSVEVKGTYGFVYFESLEAAQQAVEKMNGVELDGSELLVENSKPIVNKDQSGKLIRRLDLRIFVRGLNRGINWQDLKDWARNAGDVTYSNVFEKNGDVFGVIEYKVSNRTSFYFLCHFMASFFCHPGSRNS